MKNEKIIIIIPSLAIGGMERYVVNISEALMGLGLEVSIFLLSNNTISFKINPNIKIYASPQKQSFTLKVFSVLFKLWKLRKLVKKNKYNYLYSVSHVHSPYVLLATKYLKINTFVSDRSSPLNRYSFLTEILKSVFYPKANGIVVQTYFAKEYYINRFKSNNIFVIPNPVIEIKENNKPRKNQIITVARLVKSKRVDILLNIFSQIEHNGNWKLIIVGDGPEMDNLVLLSKKLKIESSVEFVGQSNRVNEYLLESKIFAFTSEQEGFPNALCEGMNAGLACISFDCIAGPRDIISNNINGFLIDECDISQYKIKLEELMNNPDLINSFVKNGLIFTGSLNSNKIASKLISEFKKRKLY